MKKNAVKSMCVLLCVALGVMQGAQDYNTHSTKQPSTESSVGKASKVILPLQKELIAHVDSKSRDDMAYIVRFRATLVLQDSQMVNEINQKQDLIYAKIIETAGGMTKEALQSVAGQRRLAQALPTRINRLLSKSNVIEVVFPEILVQPIAPYTPDRQHTHDVKKADKKEAQNMLPPPQLANLSPEQQALLQNESYKNPVAILPIEKEFIINLKSPDPESMGRAGFAKFRVTLLLGDKNTAKEIDAKLDFVRAVVVDTTSNFLATELQSAQGRQKLAAAITASLNSVLTDGKIAAVVFPDFIIQP